MKLIELNPTIEPGRHLRLDLDCPKCKAHRINIPIDGPADWQRTGKDFRDLTLRPSVLHKTHYADGIEAAPRYCESHFFITNGEIENV